ncbi:nitroreductase family protein [Metabacillus malikii]|uniref:Nitroreductase n=1 Tax=Metabacillus malikii TaxID=1504265 RepID=A0ABT9ZJX5_9BACI|nr:nitroreductase family protein [Metabacillus malikii]MDQ0232553.1 nitroreductase [Metabacillus malikii]
MEFYEVIEKRREITSFLEKEISDEVMEKIINAAYLAPTGNNLPSREFISIRNKEMLTKLSEATPYVKWLNKANRAIVITGRPTISKYWIQDASIASSFIWLAAVNEGVGCAFGAIVNTMDNVESYQRESFVREALSIPEDRRVLAILGLGYANEKPLSKEMLKKSDIIFTEKFETQS